MCLYGAWVRCPQRPEDGVGIPVARVIGSYEPPNVGTGTEVRFFARAVLTVNHWAISAFIHVFLYDTPACDVTKTDSMLPSRFLTSLSPQCAVNLLKNIPNTGKGQTICWLAWSKRASENWETSRFYFMWTNYSWIPGVTARISGLGTITRQGDTFHPAENLATNTRSTRGVGR